MHSGMRISLGLFAVIWKKGESIRITQSALMANAAGRVGNLLTAAEPRNGQRMPADDDSRNGVWQHTRQIDSAEGTHGRVHPAALMPMATPTAQGVFDIRPGSGAKIRSRRIMICMYAFLGRDGGNNWFTTAGTKMSRNRAAVDLAIAWRSIDMSQPHPTWSVNVSDVVPSLRG